MVLARHWRETGSRMGLNRFLNWMLAGQGALRNLFKL